MAIREIPTRTDLPAYNEVVNLDGIDYTVNLYFNDRMALGVGKWMISLADVNGKLLSAPVPGAASAALFDRFAEEAMPPGTLFVMDTSGKNIDPGRFDLGDRCRLMYIEQGTVL